MGRARCGCCMRVCAGRRVWAIALAPFLVERMIAACGCVDARGCGASGPPGGKDGVSRGGAPRSNLPASPPLAWAAHAHACCASLSARGREQVRGRVRRAQPIGRSAAGRKMDSQRGRAASAKNRGTEAAEKGEAQAEDLALLGERADATPDQARGRQDERGSTPSACLMKIRRLEPGGASAGQPGTRTTSSSATAKAARSSTAA
eukprot:scaffold31388_cov118-Isochrysis_galbana.AAC.1